MIETESLVKISRYAGERFDLIQAGGGNSSVKLENNEMLIKASGVLLSDVNENKGYSKVDFKKIENILNNKIVINEKIKTNREKIVEDLVKEATLDLVNRPSIETLLHSALYKYTLHTHPVVVNMIVVQKDWNKILLSIFKDQDISLVPYRTPGIELALELYKVIKNFDTIPKITFLQNHGLIVSSDHLDDILEITDNVLSKIEHFLQIDMSRYKLTNKISNLINSFQKTSEITYLVEDAYLNHQLTQNITLFTEPPFCPDGFVFCGACAFHLKDISDSSELNDYKDKYHELPKIIIFKNHIFIRALNVKKAKEIEEVLKFQIMVLEKNLKNNKNFLTTDELLYLSNWEAEKYRKKI